MYDIRGLKFSLQRLKCHLWGFIPSCLPTNEIVVEMLWKNRLSFHNLLSISGGKKVEYLWENKRLTGANIIRGLGRDTLKPSTCTRTGAS